MTDMQILIGMANKKDHNATVNAITFYSVTGDYGRLIKRLKKIVGSE